MMMMLRDKIESFFGRGRHSTSVPVMDGPLQPNQLLDQAPVIATAVGLDNLASFDGTFYYSSGKNLFRIAAGQNAEMVGTFGSTVACLAVDKGGALAIGLDGQGIVIRGGKHDGKDIRQLGNDKLICPTAAFFQDSDTLILTSGSMRFSSTQWKHDLMARARSGSVWRIDISSGRAEKLADGLAFPYGVTTSPQGAIIVTEAWEHRIIEIAANAKHTILLDDIPGYPSRLIPSSGGGYWLAIFAPRNQLFEFVLRERGYCDKMMAEVDPEYWIAPALTSGVSFKEPLQGGGVKQMGVLKPWSPPRSYGLVVLLGADMQPQASWHSRADGKEHGITSMCELDGNLVAGAKGPGHALLLDIKNAGGWA